MRNLLILIVTYFIIFNVSYTQLPPCNHTSKQDYTSLTNNFKLYKSSPPLSLDMPEDVIRAYIYIDSIRKLTEIQFLDFQNFLNKENYNSNFIKKFISNVLLVKEYDGIRFYKFLNQNDSLSIGLFSTYPYLYQKMKVDTLINSYYNSFAILKITFVDSLKRYNSKNNPLHTIWKGNINEIIYGSEAPPCKNVTIPIDNEHYLYSNPETKKLQIDDCIQVNHVDYTNSLFNLSLNKTYYCFLKLSSYCSNLDYSFGAFYIPYDFDFTKFKESRYYFFEVDGDNVLDPQHIFSESGKLTSNQFKSIVLDELDQARKNGTIQRTLLGVEEINQVLAQGVQIFPNPANTNILNLHFSNPEFKNISYQIISQIGEVVLKGDIKAEETLKTIELKTLSNGNYILIISSNGNQESKKFIVNK